MEPHCGDMVAGDHSLSLYVNGIAAQSQMSIEECATGTDS